MEQQVTRFGGLFVYLPFIEGLVGYCGAQEALMNEELKKAIKEAIEASKRAGKSYEELLKALEEHKEKPPDT